MKHSLLVLVDQILKVIVPRFLAFLSADYGRWARGEVRDSKGTLIEMNQADGGMKSRRVEAPPQVIDGSLKEP